MAEELLGLVEFLYDKAPARTLLLEIPASSLEFGEGLSPMTRHAVEECVDSFGELISVQAHTQAGLRSSDAKSSFSQHV
jgi:hypothetical protein